MPNIVRVHDDALLARHTVILTQGATSGRFVSSVPFPADYVAILNQTEATIYFVEGEQYSQSPEVTPVEPGGYISTRIRETQKVTCFWSSTSALPAGATATLVFSNEPIPLQAGNLTPNATTSNVAVTNTPTVNVNTLPNVNVASLPSGAIESIASGIVYNAQVSIGTGATVINVPNNLGIKRLLLKLPKAATAPIFLGKDNTVTTTTGGCLDAGDPALQIPVVPNSTLTLYGIAASAQTITVLGLA